MVNYVLHCFEKGTLLYDSFIGEVIFDHYKKHQFLRKSLQFTRNVTKSLHQFKIIVLLKLCLSPLYSATIFSLLVTISYIDSFFGRHYTYISFSTIHSQICQERKKYETKYRCTGTAQLADMMFYSCNQNKPSGA